MDFLTQARTYTGTTGRFYRTNDSPYTGVESIFNHRNYWVNVQDGSDDKATTNDTGFDLSNTDNWEYVFIDTIGRGKKKDTEEKEEENEGDEMFGLNDDTTSPRAGSQNGSPRAENYESKAGEKENLDDVEEREQILDMPPSWVGKLSIARERVALRYGNTGCRTVLYERAKMEVFAPGANEMGLLSRLTVFKDLSRTIPLEVREEFSSRKDKLYRRVRFPLKGSMHEHFKPGRKTGLKLLIDQPGRSLELYFYLTARLDGKTKRIEKIGKKVTEYFEERDDNLSFRSILLDRSNGSQNRDGKRGTYTMPCGQLGDLLVTRMKQKFTETLMLMPTMMLRTERFIWKILLSSDVYAFTTTATITFAVAQESTSKTKTGHRQKHLRQNLIQVPVRKRLKRYGWRRRRYTKNLKMPNDNPVT